MNQKDSNDHPSLANVVESLKRHAAALDALKSVPEVLQKLVSAVGSSVDSQDVPHKSKWSLGLSDEEEDEVEGQVMDVDKLLQIGDNDPEIENILQDIEKVVEYGPDLLPHIADSFAKSVQRPLTKESKSAIRDKVKVPGNCKQFVSPKVNPEIWRLLPQPAKLSDLKNQQLQNTLSSGLSILAMIGNKLAENKDKIPKDVLSTVLQYSIEGSNLFGDQFQAISSKRRFEMRRHLNPEYSAICTNAVQVGEWLFGSDLVESLKASKATSSLMRNAANRTNRFKPYNRPTPAAAGSATASPNHLNWNRQFHQWPKGNGQASFRPNFPSSFQRKAYQHRNPSQFKRQ